MGAHAALSSLVALVAAGQKSRTEIVSYFAGLFRGKLVRRWSHVWDTLVSNSSDLYPEELLDDIKHAYEEGWSILATSVLMMCRATWRAARIALSPGSQMIPIGASSRTR